MLHLSFRSIYPALALSPLSSPLQPNSFQFRSSARQRMAEWIANDSSAEAESLSAVRALDSAKEGSHKLKSSYVDYILVNKLLEDRLESGAMTQINMLNECGVEWLAQMRSQDEMDIVGIEDRTAERANLFRGAAEILAFARSHTRTREGEYFQRNVLNT